MVLMSYSGHNSFNPSIEEELLCEVQSCIGTLCCLVKILTFQVTVHIELSKEGGKVTKKLF